MSEFHPNRTLAHTPVSTPHAADPTIVSGGERPSPVVEPVPASVERYVLGEEIARGGMGVVCRATDTILGREVAVKLLHEQLGAVSAAARRFEDEARITAQLQHPGIPPIHDLGVFADGRPFLAMKLIKGRTLHELLARNREGEAPAEPSSSDKPGSAGASPSQKSGSPNLIAVFEQICQAVGYAHDRRVVHRDLKPANVMVGAFGEVQVMDWGLAKVLAPTRVVQDAEDAEPDASPATEIHIPADADSATKAGSVFGTPAYMPPEQAIGAVNRIGPWSDVFGLGAILCQILTGQPPYVGPRSAVRAMAEMGMTDDAVARLKASGADPGLVEIAVRCLAKLPADRPADGGVVAKAVAEHRAGVEERAKRAELDLVRAEGEKARAEAEAREQRKRRRVQLALAGTVGLLLLGGGVFAWWLDKQATVRKEQLGRNSEAVAALLEECEAALIANDAARATLALGAAEKRAAEGGAEGFADRLTRDRAELALLGDLNAIDRYRWTPVHNKYPGKKVLTDRWQVAFAAAGLDPEASPAAVADRVKASHLRDRVVAAFNLWLIHTPTAGVREVLRLLDPDPYRDAVRDAAVAEDWGRVTKLAEQPDAAAQPPGFAAAIVHFGNIPVARRRAIMGAVLRTCPNDLTLLMALGNSYSFYPKDGLTGALRWYQAAVATHPANPESHYNLGLVLQQEGKLDEAIAEYREAIRLDDTYSPAHNNLGVALREKGDLAGAVTAHRKAIELDPKNAAAYTNLGNDLADQGEPDRAIAAYREAMTLDPSHAEAYSNLGLALMNKGELAEAVKMGKKAAELDPENGWVFNNLGAVLREAGDLDGAVEAHKESVRLDPKKATFHGNLATVYYLRYDYPEAIESARAAITLEPETARFHIQLGRLLSLQGDMRGARKSYSTAARIDPEKYGLLPYAPAPMPVAPRPREAKR